MCPRCSCWIDAIQFRCSHVHPKPFCLILCSLFFFSTVHTVSALEHPLSAVLKDVLNSTITPVQGQLGLFRISGASLCFAQNTLNWPTTNVSSALGANSLSFKARVQNCRKGAVCKIMELQRNFEQLPPTPSYLLHPNPISTSPPIWEHKSCLTI